MPRPRRDPKARVAIQTEADPRDRAIEYHQTNALRLIALTLASIDQTLKVIALRLKPPPQPPQPDVTMSINIGPVTYDRAEGAGETLMLTLTDEQKCSLSIAPLTAAGNPARIDGTPVWSSSDVNIISLDVATDGMSCVARTPGNLGTSTVSCTADADLGTGVRELVALLDVTVIAAEAATMGIATGTPEIE